MTCILKRKIIQYASTSHEISYFLFFNPEYWLTSFDKKYILSTKIHIFTKDQTAYNQ